MGRCLNCIHFDVCDSDRHEKERLYGDCSDFLNDDTVVPKSEVDRLQCEVNRLKKYDEERDIALHARLIAETREKVAREIFKEIEEVFRQHTEGGYYLNGAWFPERFDLYTGDAIAELKKKYIGGQK